MGYINNYGYNRKKMEIEFTKIAAICREDGVSEENIEAIHRQMLDDLNNERRFYRHTQPYDGMRFTDGDEVDEGRSPLLDKQHFGRTFSVESDGIYTVKLGVFHDLKSGILEESALSFTLPIKAACEQAITATFYIPEASARVMDAVILKSTQAFQITLVDGSPVLERYDNQWGMPLEYSRREAGNVMILERTGLRKNVPRQYRAYFDLLSIQIEVMFVI